MLDQRILQDRERRPPLARGACLGVVMGLLLFWAIIFLIVFNVVRPPTP